MYIYVLLLLLLQFLLVSALSPWFVTFICVHGLGWSEKRRSLTLCTCCSRLHHIDIIQIWVPPPSLWRLQHLLGDALIQTLLKRQVIIFNLWWIITCVQLYSIPLISVLCNLGWSCRLLHLFERLRLRIREVRDGVLYPVSGGASSACWILV